MAHQNSTSAADEAAARTRVRQLALDLSEPRSATWIGQAAEVDATPVVVGELVKLVEFGRLRTMEGPDGETVYAPVPQSASPTDVEPSRRTTTPAGRRHHRRRIQRQIEAWKVEYDCDSRAELDRSLRAGTLTREERHERIRVLREWGRYEDTLRVLGHGAGQSAGVNAPSSAASVSD